MVVADQSHRDLLEEAGVETIEVLAPLWRNTQAREYTDLHGEPVRGLVDFTHVYVLHLTAQTAAATETAYNRIRGGDLARYVALDALFSAQGCFTSTFDPDDPYYDQQWGLHNDGSFPDDSVITAVEDVDVNFPEAAEIQSTCDTHIAILDTGVRSTHDDLADNYDASLDTSIVGGSTSDTASHGTLTAGVAAAITDNDEGIASPGGIGSAKKTLVNVKVAGNLSYSTSDLVEGIEYATRHDVPVINMSLGQCVKPNLAPDAAFLWPLRDAMYNAFISGVLPVAAAGNGDPVIGCNVREIYPAAFERLALGVGHILPDSTRNSNFDAGYWVDVVAPGGHADNDDNRHAYIVSTCYSGDSDYADGSTCGYFGGTSASAPLTSAIAALLWSFEPDLTNEDVAQVLMRTARDYGATGPDHEWGAGLIRADDAMEYVGCDNVFEKGSITGYDDITAGSFRTQRFRNVKVLNDTTDTWLTTYARPWKVEKDIDFGSTTVNDYWARTRGCPTWADTLDYDGNWHATWADVTQISGGEGTIFGFIYEVWADDTMAEFLGWYPDHPDSAATWEWNYSLTSPESSSRLALGAPTDNDATLRASMTADDHAVFRFSLANDSVVNLQVFDVRGRLVREWELGRLVEGNHEVRWDAPISGRTAAGVYFARLRAGESTARTKLVVH